MEEIEQWLKKEYERYGRDYTFRVKNIAKALNINSQTVVMEIQKLKKKKIIKVFVYTNKHNIYKTCFKGGKNGRNNKS